MLLNTDVTNSYAKWDGVRGGYLNYIPYSR